MSRGEYEFCRLPTKPGHNTGTALGYPSTKTQELTFTNWRAKNKEDPRLVEQRKLMDMVDF